MDRSTHWQSQLAAYGASIDADGVVSHFGDRKAELRALRDTAALVPLTNTGVVRVSGEDAQTFLNTQFTSDVVQVSAGAAQYSSYCTPKGRVLATFLICLYGSDYLLILPQEIAESVAAGLKRYVLRAKVKIAAETESYALLGIAGPQSASVADSVIGKPQVQPMQVAPYGAVSLITLPGEHLLVICDRNNVDEYWRALDKEATASGVQVFELQGIRAGIATVTTATQDSFIPQMLGLEMIGAVSFEKGCYPGQEIVARTKYLGNLKRQLCYGYSDNMLAAGDTISMISDGKTAGTVTNAAPNLEGQWEFLAVMQGEALQTQASLGSANGQSVRIERPVAQIVAENDP